MCAMAIRSRPRWSRRRLTKKMTESPSPELIEQLTAFSSCAVANAIEGLGRRLRNVGFSNSTIQCRFPRLKPIVGFAVTLRLHGSNPPMEGGVYIERTDWWDDLKTTSVPRIVVIEDADHHPGIAAFIGETHAAILQAMGCVGVVTNGAVRDLDPVERLGFQLFSPSTGLCLARLRSCRESGFPGSCRRTGNCSRRSLAWRSTRDCKNPGRSGRTGCSDRRPAAGA